MPDPENPALEPGDQSDGGETPGAEGTTPPTPPPGISQEKVNKLVGRARNEGREGALRDLLTELGIESKDELAKVVETVRERVPKAPTKEERLHAKHSEELRAETAKREAEVTLLQKQLEDEKITNFSRQVLSDARDSDLLLIAIKRDSGHDLAVQSGKIVVVDAEGDPVAEEPQKWLTSQAKKDAHKFLMKPSGTTTATKSRNNRPPKVDPDVNYDSDGAIASLVAEQFAKE